MITLTWIVEDTASAPLKQEHGYAVWIESPDGIVLYDTGGSGEVLLHNMGVLGFDPARIDTVVISHAHDDHTGGLKALMDKVRSGTPLYAQSSLFRARYATNTDGDMAYRGIPLKQDALEAVFDVRLSDAPVEVLPGIWTTGRIHPRPYPEGRSSRHFIASGDGYVPDPYQDDLSMVIQAPEGKFLLVGCCHAGLLNTMQTVDRLWPQPLIGVAGGTHLNSATTETIELTIHALQERGDVVQTLGLCHCSGKAFMASAKQHFGHAYKHVVAGTVLELGV